MKTSYYQNAKLKSGKFYPVRISIGHPRFGTQPAAVLPEAAPTEEMHGREYTKDEYFARLDANAGAILKAVENMPETAVFCCFEKDITLCHREWFAGWLEDKLNITVEEL
jgi:hypothetical protein